MVPAGEERAQIAENGDVNLPHTTRRTRSESRVESRSYGEDDLCRTLSGTLIGPASSFNDWLRLSVVGKV